MRQHSIFLLLLLSLLFWAAPTRAAQSYDNCTGFITSLPATIGSQGTWCFNKDLNTAITSGNAIAINANNVTLDCNDFRLQGPGAPGFDNTSVGIYSADRVNLTVRHCHVSGFDDGVHFAAVAANSASAGHTIEDNEFRGSHRGVWLVGDSSVVRRNSVSIGRNYTTGDAVGILAEGGVDIIDNTVWDVGNSAPAPSNAIGILLSSADGNSINGNRIHRVSAYAGYAKGISVLSSNKISLRNNELTGSGIDCDNNSDRSKANVINHFTPGISGCSDDGNVVSP